MQTVPHQRLANSTASETSLVLREHLDYRRLFIGAKKQKFRSPFSEPDLIFYYFTSPHPKQSNSLRDKIQAEVLLAGTMQFETK